VTSAQEKTGGSINENGGVKTSAVPPSQKWTRRYSPEGIFWGIGLLSGLLSLGLGIAISHQCGKELCDASRAVTHTRQVLEKLGGISTRLSEMESAARSFAISSKQSQLAPLYAGVKAVPDEVEDLKILLRDDPDALRAVTNIEPAITRRVKSMREMAELSNKNLQRKLTEEGSTLEEIQTAFSGLGKIQREQLAREETEVTAGSEHLTMLSLAGSALAAVLVLAFGVWGLRALNSLGKTEEKLSRLLGSMPDALVLVNADGKILSSNTHTAKLFGYTERELQGQSMALLVPERVRPSQRQYYEGFFLRRNGGVHETSLDLWVLHKDGRDFPI